MADDGSDADPLFEDDSLGTSAGVFSNPELLDVDFIPDRNYIVGRKEEMETIADGLRPLVRGEQPASYFIHGPAGCGKTLIARHVANRAASTAERYTVDSETIYVDCAGTQTPARTARAIAREANDVGETAITVPQSGTGIDGYLDRFRSILSKRSVDGTIIILDNLDHLHRNTTGDSFIELMQPLGPARRSPIENTAISIIGIGSGRTDVATDMKRAVGCTEISFEPYTLTAVKEILDARADAFVPDALADGVIAKTAVVACRGQCDCSRAIRILRQAGKIAEDRGTERVSKDLLDEAQFRAKITDLADRLASLSNHTDYVLLALLRLSKTGEYDAIRTKAVYDAYCDICQLAGEESLGYKRVSELLEEVEFLGLTSVTHTGGGNEGGSFKVHQFVPDAAVVEGYLERRVGGSVDEYLFPD